jgi:nucleoid DNA-binding protein
MKKQDLAARLARQAHISKAAAADRLDRVIHEILSGLKRGKPVLLPGLGALTPSGKRGVELVLSGEVEENSGAKQR